MRQSTSTILMVRPASFQFNYETAQSNEFQNEVTNISKEDILSIAQKEFDTMVEELRAHNIDVTVIDDTPLPEKPDAIFPNNWISMSQSGLLTIFPMKNHNRQLEKRQDIVDFIEKNYQVKQLLNLSHYELEDKALEGTGSIVFDHLHKVAYACLSPRTEQDILTDYCNQIGYEPFCFHSYDQNKNLIYHTNVVMCVGSGYVIIGLETITQNDEKERILHKFNACQLEVIALTNEQLLHSFAGNMLQVENKDGKLFLVMSRRAYHSLTEEQKNQIKKYAELLPVSIDLIETIGGGSARCMMAEIFLEKK